MLSSRTSNIKHFHSRCYCNTQDCLLSDQRQSTTSKKFTKISKLLLPSRKRKRNEAKPEVFGKRLKGRWPFPSQVLLQLHPCFLIQWEKSRSLEEQGRLGIEGITDNDLFPDFCRGVPETSFESIDEKKLQSLNQNSSLKPFQSSRKIQNLVEGFVSPQHHKMYSPFLDLRRRCTKMYFSRRTSP